MYVDTSVVVKLYIKEPDSEACEATVAGTTLVSSRLLYCEFRTALLGKVSRGIISTDLRAEAWQEFEKDVAAQKIRLISLNDLLLRDAADLLSDLYPNAPLGTLDALHLATYLSIETGDGSAVHQRPPHAPSRGAAGPVPRRLGRFGKHLRVRCGIRAIAETRQGTKQRRFAGN
jgi:predicted nucleic acid-binding protein